MIKIKKDKAFSLIEIIICILVISILTNVAFLKYRDFKEKRDVQEAKIKINETFYFTSIESLKRREKLKIKLDFSKKELVIQDKISHKIKMTKLPKSLIYYTTHSSHLNNLEIFFTKNGNISKSFSIYIFNLNGKVRYKISFYGFDENRFLKINNYRKNPNNDISYLNISKYHKITNEDRKEFYIDWRKE